MNVLSGFYVVTAYFGVFLVRFGAWLTGMKAVIGESSPVGNFSPVSGDELMHSIVHGLADAGVALQAAPLVRDAVLRRHVVVSRSELPSVRSENGFLCGGGVSRHEHTPPLEVRRHAVALLSIAESLDSRHG